MTTIKRQARTAGFLYLLLAVTAPLGLLIVPGRLIVDGDPHATATLIRGSETLFRLGMASELFHQAVVIFVVLALFRLFRHVNVYRARELVVLGALVSVPIMFLNVVNEMAALVLLEGPDFLSVFEPTEREALAYLFLYLHEQGIFVTSIFWGLWLFPFGVLVIQSGFIPRVLGYLLLLAGIGYVTAATRALLFPDSAPIVGRIAGILELAEIPILFWLAIWGASSDAPLPDEEHA